MLLLFACAPRVPLSTPLAGAEGPPAPVADATVEWFDLGGSDRIDLVESCLSACPRDDTGEPVASITRWSVGWLWTRSPTDPCEVDGATLDVAVTVALPRWVPPADADPALVLDWQAFVGALARHEQGHVDLVHSLLRDAAGHVDAAGCAAADRAGDEVMAELADAEAAYDIATDHGHSQGADFWP